MQHLPASTNRLIGQAMHQYNMLSDGDRVLVAVSGGVDSLSLAAILKLWQQKAPITYSLEAVHLDMGFGSLEHHLVEEQLSKIGIAFQIERTSIGKDALQTHTSSACFHCSRNRRTTLFNMAKEMGCNKMALGHHKEDIIETFFINLFYGGNLSTMLPRQDLFDGNLAIIRPLAFLQKDQVEEIAELFGITPVANPCPLTESSKRHTVRELLKNLYQNDANLMSNIFAALGNVKTDYLLDDSLRQQEK